MGYKSSSNARRDVAVFASIAALFIASAWIIGKSLGPFEADPDYAYLLNGLDILTFKSPGIYIHPGTPVQVIIAAAIIATWLVRAPFHGFVSVPDDVVKNPVLYLDCANILFMIGVTSALVFFAWRVRTFSGKITPAVVGALSTFLLLPTFLTFHKVTPEPALLAATFLLMGIIAPAAFAQTFVESRRFSLAIGILIGFCISAKATAAPLLLIIFFLRSSEARKRIAITAVMSALVFTAPIKSRYADILSFYLRLYTHSGYYGIGDFGAPAPSKLLEGIHSLLVATPETFLCLLVYALVLVGYATKRIRLSENLARLLLLCVVFIGLDLLLLSKQPIPRYLIITVPFLCIGNAAVTYCLLENAKLGVRLKVILVAIIAALGFWREYSNTQRDALLRASYMTVLSYAEQSGCLLVPYYEVNTVEYDLGFGNAWAGNRFTDNLRRLYPRYISYNFGQNEFEDFAGRVSAAEMYKRFPNEKCVYFIGSPAERYDNFIPKELRSLVAQSLGGRAGAVAVFAVKPGWNHYDNGMK